MVSYCFNILLPNPFPSHPSRLVSKGESFDSAETSQGPELPWLSTASTHGGAPGGVGVGVGGKVRGEAEGGGEERILSTGRSLS